MKRIFIENSSGRKTPVRGKLYIAENVEQPSNLATLTSSTPDRDIYTINLFSDEEVDKASLLNTAVIEWFRDRDYFAPCKTINGIKPVDDKGTLLLFFGPCMSYVYVYADQSPMLNILDMCPSCETDCEDIDKAEKELAKLWMRLNVLKDAFLPYTDDVFMRRQRIAAVRFKADPDRLESIGLDLSSILGNRRNEGVLKHYVKAINMLNYCVLISNRKKTIAALREDATGFTVQFVHAFPASSEDLEISATVEISADTVTDDDKISLLIVDEATKLKLIDQDDEETTAPVTVTHKAPLTKVLKSDKIAARSDKPVVLNMTAMFVPFFYIKATDTTDKFISLDEVGEDAERWDAEEAEDNKFIYRRKENKTGLVLAENAEQLLEATKEHYDESKLYPTQNVDGTDRWKLKITWNVYKEGRESKISDVFLFEVSKVKQPVYDLVNDSTWITSIEAK